MQFNQAHPNSELIQICLFLSKFRKSISTMVILDNKSQAATVAVFMEPLYDTLPPFSAATGSPTLFVPYNIYSMGLKEHFSFRNLTL